ncbi:hypothetical protein [Jiella sonneratiae]|uniref:PepSY domain-containing protein n=1 Tax=Jiella sonneratiae TaxID=2816856 RepID=A0ABS3J3K0_9HYPH|nr:hypothetical protein [Jiella sonneratiae]MBO0904239.1 hypothetical protein [Jiella sonneratiae]
MRRRLPIALAMFLSASGVLAAQTRQESMDRVVAQLGLQEVEIQQDKHFHGPDIEGRLPDGTWVAVNVDWHGDIEEIEAHGHGGFSAEAVAPLLPEAVRNNDSWPSQAKLHKLEFHDGRRIEVEGDHSDGHEFKAEFAPDGQLIEMKIGD